MIKKEAEKISKYEEFIIEIQRMCNVRAKLISVKTGATGIISKSLRKYLSNTEEKQEIQEIQKNCHIVHCAHTAASADVKVQNTFQGRNNITCSTNCEYRTAATLYTLQKWFVSGM